MTRAFVSLTTLVGVFLAGLGISATSARATPGPFGVELGLEGSWYPSDSVAVASADGFLPQSLVAFSYSPLDVFALYAGWRHLGALQRSDALAGGGSAFGFETTGDAIVVGGRVTLPIVGGLVFIGELDLEAAHVATRVTFDGRYADTGAWAPGAVPKLGLAYRSPLDDTFGLDLRLTAGYALRLDHALASVAFGPDPDVRTAPTDLGALNLSGPLLAATVAITF